MDAGPPRLDRPLRAYRFTLGLFVLILLRHPTVPSHVSGPLRLAILPFVLYDCLTSPFSYRWHPTEESTLVALGHGLACLQGGCKAVEWALSSEDFRRVPAAGDPPMGRTGVLEPVLWASEQMSTTRGIGWSWGTPLSRLPPPHRDALAVCRRIIIGHVLLVAAMSILTLSRAPDAHRHDPSVALDQLSVPAFPGRSLVGEGLLTIAFGVSLIVGIDLGFTLVTLVALVAQTSLHALAPSVVPSFDLRRYPPMFDSPHLSTTVQELWAKRWHAQFSRTFRVMGYDPAVALTRRIGVGKTGQKAVGALAVFTLSGLFHEFAVYVFSGLPPSIRDSGFPLTLTFFLAQPVAIFALDPLASRHLARPLRIAYVWAFVVASCTLFRRAYLDLGMLDAPVPSLDDWSVWRWTVPMAVLVPKSLL